MKVAIHENHKGGLNICGVSIWVVSLENHLPKPSGHVRNLSGLPFATCYEILDGMTVPALLNRPGDAMIDRLCEAARKLERQGARDHRIMRVLGAVSATDRRDCVNRSSLSALTRSGIKACLMKIPVLVRDKSHRSPLRNDDLWWWSDRPPVPSRMIT